MHICFGTSVNFLHNNDMTNYIQPIYIPNIVRDTDPRGQALQANYEQERREWNSDSHKSIKDIVAADDCSIAPIPKHGFSGS